MTGNSSLPWSDQQRYRAVTILSLGAIGFTGILSFFADPLFQPFFRSVPPLLAVFAISVLGMASLGFLSSRGWFEVYSRREHLRGVTWSSGFATMFAVVIILADLLVIFPYRHVPPPQSLLFYPAIAYVAEVVFHLLPLSILLALLSPLLQGRDSNKLIWLCIVLASCPEPIFQLNWRSSESPLSWTDVYVGLHVFAFNLLQLVLFRRYDFISMYACRLVYYLYWHVLWGFLRHDLLPV